MDRTTIAPYKAEERELSILLYKKLEGLMLLYPPTEDFRKCFSVDMFLKANQNAFFHVMHYLFRLYDPVEFKKRFYWPITDKRAESTFRSSTVEYLKYLNEKHHLNWNIKSYLVVMPGGMKFITFLLDLVGFIITEQVRIREKHLGADSLPESEWSLKQMQRQNTLLKDYSSDYIKEIDDQIANLRIKTQSLKDELEIIEISNPKCFIDKKFLNVFEQSNNELLKQRFLKLAQNINEMEDTLKKLKVAMEQFQAQNTEIRKDKSTLKHALQKIFLGESLLDVEDDVSMNSIVSAFVLVYPSINEWLSNIVDSSVAGHDNVTSELNAIKAELQQLDSQIGDFQKKNNVSRFKKEEAFQAGGHCDSPLMFKYVFTPPIKFNMAETSNARLPLQDDNNLMEGCSNLLGVPNTNRIKKKGRGHDQSFDSNTTLNRSKIIDPVQLLRTIYKDTTKKALRPQHAQAQQRHNLALLGQKWKEHQQNLFDIDKDISVAPGSPCPISEQNLKDIPSPKTPFNASSGDITRITLTASYERRTSIPPKKSIIVKKIQDASLNIRNLSTSPSGRLEPLVQIDEIDVSLKTKNDFKVDEGMSENFENNANLLNTPIKFLANLSAFNEDDDEIFHTSDTVLKDIL